MKLQIFTIVLDGQPWIGKHLQVFQNSNLDWRWVIVEGTARPTKDTQWVRGIAPRLSTDGTSEYVDAITDTRVKVIRRERWENKTSMCNAALSEFSDGIVLQVDADELWTSSQLVKLMEFFATNQLCGGARFYCNYFLGPEIIATSKDGYGNRSTEWERAWRFKRGKRFITHEPPKLGPITGRIATRDETRNWGLVFNHMSWVLPEQVKNKCEYYGGNYSFEAWQNLQNNTVWPVNDLQQLLPWVGPNASADKVQ